MPHGAAAPLRQHIRFQGHCACVADSVGPTCPNGCQSRVTFPSTLHTLAMKNNLFFLLLRRDARLLAWGSAPALVLLLASPVARA